MEAFLAVAIVTVACKFYVPSASDDFLLKNDNSVGKTREASKGVEYDFCPVWSVDSIVIGWSDLSSL